MVSNLGYDKSFEDAVYPQHTPIFSQPKKQRFVRFEGNESQGTSSDPDDDDFYHPEEGELDPRGKRDENENDTHQLPVIVVDDGEDTEEGAKSVSCSQ